MSVSACRRSNPSHRPHSRTIGNSTRGRILTYACSATREAPDRTHDTGTAPRQTQRNPGRFNQSELHELFQSGAEREGPREPGLHRDLTTLSRAQPDCTSERRHARGVKCNRVVLDAWRPHGVRGDTAYECALNEPRRLALFADARRGQLESAAVDFVGHRSLVNGFADGSIEPLQ
jgi:hypothetical protein